MNQTKRLLAAVLVVMIASAAMIGERVTATSPQPLSLQQALALARADNPELLISRAQKARAEATRVKTRQGILPTVSLDATYLNADVGLLDRVSSGALVVPPVPGVGELNPVEGNLVGMQLVQPLINVGAWHARTQAGHAEGAARLGLHRAEHEVAVATIEAYFGAGTAQRQLSAEARGLAAARRALRQAEAFVDQGLATRLDVLNARTRVGEMEARLALAERRVVASHAMLRQVLGLDGDGLLELTDPVPEPAGQLPQEEFLPAERKDLLALEEAVKAAEAGVDRARAAYLPDLNIFARYQRIEMNQPFGFDETDWIVGVNFGWTLFAGFGQQGALDEARATEQERRAELRGLHQRARREVRDTHAWWRAELQAWRSAAVSVAAAEEALALTERRYAEGLDDMAALLRAQAEELAALTRETSARYNVLVAAQRYGLASGAGNPGELWP
ncbi:TolC family protein [Thioalkalivibrio sp. XN8]|uniref:TolC family protein n=1 Tax=Thioalkalivibrio sp. XN8 TaxID=2712863 RepID=UPI0013ED7AA3|nr:TolC family protein [Thioalkalivibrio sp. XN8]NGP54720.1 TolC family protein [Thioalkalivibrio sp. XN8]